MAWSYKNVWNAFDYSGHDNVYLRDSVYPGLKDIADFFAALVVKDKDGFYNINKSELREGNLGTNAMDCIAAAKWFWKTASEASIILNTDATNRAVWQQHLAKIKPYYLMPDGTFGGIIEKGRVKQYKMLQHYIVNVTDEYNLESSPADQKLAYNSCEHSFLGADVPELLGRSPNDFTGGAPCWFWMFNRQPWLMYYSIKVLGLGINYGDPAPHYSPRQAGLAPHWRNGIFKLNTSLKKTVACWFEPERLCNSRSGTIFFFPCVPGRYDVAFKDFQARGGFLVTGELRKGRVTFAQIQARRTTGCAVMNPWPGRTLIVKQQPENIPVVTAHVGEKYTFAAEAGKSYRLQPSP